LNLNQGFFFAKDKPGKKRRETLVGTASKATITHNTRNIKAKTRGSNTVQQNVMS
jgi:hypothetical protein